MNLKYGLLLVLLLAASACGFQLRGSNLDALQDSRIFIQSRAGSDLALELNRQLSLSGVNVTDVLDSADYIIEVSGENFERDVLSVSSDTGKVEEYELTKTTRLDITDAGKQQLINNEPLTARRDYIFDQDSVLGKFDEQEKIIEELNRELAATIIRRLRVVTR